MSEPWPEPKALLPPAWLSRIHPLARLRYEWHARACCLAPCLWGSLIVSGRQEIVVAGQAPITVTAGDLVLVAADTVLRHASAELVEIRIYAETAHALACLGRIHAAGGPDLRPQRICVRRGLVVEGNPAWLATDDAAPAAWLAEAFWWQLAATVAGSAGAAGLVWERLPPPWLQAAIAGCESGDVLREGVHALARLAHRSLDQCNRAVRAAYGCTATDLINRLRLRHAERLLRHGEWSVAAVAERVGFRNRAHFHRLFAAAHNGMGPGAWRRGNVPSPGHAVPAPGA